VPQTPVPPGFERSRINADLFKLAVTTAMSALPRAKDGRPGVSISEISRATGVNAGRLSELLNHGKVPPATDCISLLAWMHIDAALVLDPLEPKVPQVKEPAGQAAA
jgi:hypothetical protein